jgi:hypothetical protein
MPKITYQNKRFSEASLSLIKTCNAIIAQYTAQGFTLTLRQLYYQLVSRGVIPNEQKEYKRVGSVINDARLAGKIDWNALEDRTRNVKSVSHWDSPEEIIEAIADQFRMDKWCDCSVRPEVWIEKDALVGVIEDVCRDEDVSYFSCRGYTSQSEMWGAAMRFLKYHEKFGQGVHVIHLGDHDPSGQDMSRDIEDRIRMFLRHHNPAAESSFSFTRIALNMDQIQQYNPPPNPAKSTDSRFKTYADLHGDDSWELDALDPTVIADLIRNKIVELRDDDEYRRVEDEENDHRRLLTLCSENWERVTGVLEGKRDED